MSESVAVYSRRKEQREGRGKAEGRLESSSSRFASPYVGSVGYVLPENSNDTLGGLVCRHGVSADRRCRRTEVGGVPGSLSSRASSSTGLLFFLHWASSSSSHAFIKPSDHRDPETRRGDHVSHASFSFAKPATAIFECCTERVQGEREREKETGVPVEPSARQLSRP